jgi:hypothetical protein
MFGARDAPALQMQRIHTSRNETVTEHGYGTETGGGPTIFASIARDRRSLEDANPDWITQGGLKLHVQHSV